MTDNEVLNGRMYRDAAVDERDGRGGDGGAGPVPYPYPLCSPAELQRRECVRDIHRLLREGYPFLDADETMAERMAKRISENREERQELLIMIEAFKGLLAPFFYRVYTEVLNDVENEA